MKNTEDQEPEEEVTNIVNGMCLKLWNCLLNN